ncbi:Bug family tripartite tricarboxylate transporter substrate binding protein [Achromobacter aloeverae]
MNIKSQVVGACLAVLGAAGALGAHAEEAYPSRPIKLVVPFGPGGVTDLTGRTFAKFMGEKLGATIVVENRPGAGATIGANHVAKAAPDGYTILLGTNVTHAISPLILPSVPYDPIRDFEPVGIFGTNGNVLVVNPAFPARNFKEFIAQIKARKGHVNYASGSVGSSAHMAAELLKQEVPGLQYTHVPYSGPSSAMSALIGNQVDFMFTNIGAAVSQIKAGTVIPIAVTTDKRVAELPDVPTVAESGVPGFEVVGWLAAFVPKGTPPDIVKRLNAALVASQDEPALRKTLDAASLVPVQADPQQTGAFVHAEYEKWSRVVREAHIKPVE